MPNQDGTHRPADNGASSRQAGGEKYPVRFLGRDGGKAKTRLTTFGKAVVYVVLGYGVVDNLPREETGRAYSSAGCCS
jgi:hypothetical protein